MREVPIIDRYTVDELKQIVKESQTVADVIRTLGYYTTSGSNRNTVINRIQKYNIDTSHFKPKTSVSRTDDEIFVKNSPVVQSVVRNRYRKISDNTVCEICGQPNVWNDKPLVMRLDHIDGDKHNNLKENLRWICPNCDTQLDTFGTKNLAAKHHIYEEYIKNVQLDDQQNYPISEFEDPLHRSYTYNPNRVLVNQKSEYKKVPCPICGKEKSISAAICKECNDKKQAINIPDIANLIDDLCILHSMEDIGRKYNVSSNSVRKWCKKYNLPYHVSDIRNNTVFINNS